MAKKSAKGSGKPLPRIKLKLALSPKQGEELLKTRQVRFEKNMNRHKGPEWSKIQARLEMAAIDGSELDSTDSSVRIRGIRVIRV